MIPQQKQDFLYQVERGYEVFYSLVLIQNNYPYIIIIAKRIFCLGSLHEIRHKKKKKKRRRLYNPEILYDKARKDSANPWRTIIFWERNIRTPRFSSLAQIQKRERKNTGSDAGHKDHDFQQRRSSSVHQSSQSLQHHNEDTEYHREQ